MELKDKVVLITGSSSGIGKTTAIRFANEGAKIAVNYRENKSGGEETVKAIEEAGGEAMLIQADISDPKQVERMFEELIDRFSTIDILINNAAIPNDRVPY